MPNKKGVTFNLEPMADEDQNLSIGMNSMKMFINQHKKEADATFSKLKHLGELTEQMKVVETCKSSTFDDLNRCLEEKSNALVEANEKYENLKYFVKNLHTYILCQAKRYAELEISYENNRGLSHEECEQLVKTAVASKEAKFAEYLKDMRQQLEEANRKTLLFEQQTSQLQAQLEEAYQKTILSEQRDSQLKAQLDEVNQKTLLFEQQKSQLQTRLEEANQKTLLFEQQTSQLQAQLEQANQKALLCEQRDSQLQERVIELEKLLEKLRSDAELEKQNQVKHKDVAAKLKKRLNKKIERLDELDKMVITLRTEKKALEDTLKVQDYKILDLQRVLDRPVNVTSATSAGNETAQKQIEHVEPLQIDDNDIDTIQNKPSTSSQMNDSNRTTIRNTASSHSQKIYDSEDENSSDSSFFPPYGGAPKKLPMIRKRNPNTNFDLIKRFKK